VKTFFTKKESFLIHQGCSSHPFKVNQLQKQGWLSPEFKPKFDFSHTSAEMEWTSKYQITLAALAPIKLFVIF
jgi:hypothetical protein